MKNMLMAVAAIALLPVPAFAQEADVYNDEEVAPTARDGVRAEARVWWERINDPDEAANINYELGSGFAFGGEIGYDVAVSDSIVVGPYVGYDVSTIEECDGGLCVGSDGYFSAGLHVGFATGPSSQAYLKAGYSSLSISVQGPIDDGAGGVINLDETETGGGYDFAFGYELGFGANAYGRIELGVGEAYDIYGFDFQRTHGGVAVGMRF